MQTQKILFVALICSALSFMLPSGSVSAVVAGQSSSGSADISATVPDFIILHYHSSLDLNFETPKSEAINEGENTLSVTWQGESSGSQLAGGSLMSANLELDGATKRVTIPNVWAIRGFSETGTASVTIAIPSGKGTLSTKDGTSLIEMTGVQVSSSGNIGETITASLNGITKSRATLGNVLIDLNFDKTKKSGFHYGGQYTITASTK
jgi:hypothetical protein